ncbi:metalloregulator ArsR/SmtB family transcription factor [Haliea sp. E1-2-M8]|nr:metalloregulator ArsR/SmtB family transcription factor [Haliea sp. E1-2-M8]MDO8862219.1 metalloregulator ArsR/SmtB family transcription factor [Haliea sp. E1-2-M8]
MDADAMALRAGEAAQLLKQLANEKRLMILCALVEGEQSVGALNAAVALSQSALSQHLARLREAGLVTTRRDGQLIYYALAGDKVPAILHVLHTVYCAD